MAGKATEKEKEVEQKDLVVQNTSFDLDAFGAFASDNGTTGLESLDQTDLKLPKYKVIQPTSEEATGELELKPGVFYNTVTKETTDKLQCILLALGKSRVMWPPVFKRGDKPLCRSFDGQEKTEGCGDGKCGTCQYSQWKTDGEKPDCTMGYVWLGVDAENRPFRISAQGASVSPTKDFLNAVAPKLKRGGKHLGIFVFKLELTTEKQKNDKGTYYTIKYSIVDTIDPNDYAELEGMSDSLRELFLQAIDKDNVTVDAEDYGDTGAETPEGTEAPAGTKKNGALF